ncbi:RNA polymerase II holoenzyme/mediator complex component Rgr1, putative [Talaromyces stipitatus ATCC 10500]|uniref:Mediator of RNA polymerase II transcription subunit 14 n=1 Tax=Talaromyces stipitatus (strain ATCC 10500 / CBS 375.48 / QM 6759 / NRRL 1006) TaxID=441959 RepID=B8LT82_TALSN|nr:RNA polymerase II holoenzyme/mediator complex component Rgr1, putative [Talaromyces stipitatus ATCC 10500]EED23590.1 RNA polymerase II holoenzyme/mediator complex component Rgr1, putative [Talaromyces stipitatus ATCC 10500]
MPGLVMDDVSASASRYWGDSYNRYDSNGVPHADNHEKPAQQMNGFKGDGSTGQGSNMAMVTKHGQSDAMDDVSWQWAPPLTHITQGFFPYAQLVNRAVQQCYNDLCDVIAELAESTQPQQSSQATSANGKPDAAAIQKKIRILEFAQAKRTEFIKLLVLSQWSRQAVDVSKLIDLQNFIRTRHSAYQAAVQRVADMKRDLVRAQVANPDLQTALEVLTTGRVSNMPEFGYKPPKPLSPRRLLATLQKINRMISTRLVTSDVIPPSFNEYRVHDGRVTFSVKGEFELDLSIAEEDVASQFYFIDIRFLFTPSSPIPKGRFFNELDSQMNSILKAKGLTGCFDFLHNLVLVNKINILFKQAISLSRGQWIGALRVELLHRILVVHYWPDKSGPKSWLEIGAHSGRQLRQKISYLGLRWIREGKEFDSSHIHFDMENLSMESILRSVIAIHSSHILRNVYERFCTQTLFANHQLSINLQISRTEPGNCRLNVQLTGSRYLNASVEPVSGAMCIHTIPSLLCRLDKGGNSDDDLVNRISRLRCIAAMEEIESDAKTFGWESVDHRKFKVDIRRVFPSNVLRASFFRNRLFGNSWIIAATTSLSGDDWWLLRLKARPSPSPELAVHARIIPGGFSVQSTRVLSGDLFLSSQGARYHFPDLDYSLTGALVMYSNALWLSELGYQDCLPPVEQLQLGSRLEVPCLYLKFDIAKLPKQLRIAPLNGTQSKSYIRDTLSISYHGIDSRTKNAIVVAHGRFLTPLRKLGLKRLKLDDCILLRRGGMGFAMRFLVAPGQSIMLDLFERIQRLNIVLSLFRTLQKHKITVKSVSLSNLSFVYAPQEGFEANIVIRLDGPGNTPDLDPAIIRQQNEPLFRLRLDISFNNLSPHNRIKQSLGTILNRSGPGYGVQCVLQLLKLTLSVLRALDRLVTEPKHNSALRVQVSIRGAQTYQIHYFGLRFRFLLTASQRRGSIIWTLKDISSSEGQRDVEQAVEAKLQEKIYRGKGDGWQGLGNGAVAKVDQVGNLLSELDSCFADLTPPSAPPEKAALCEAAEKKMSKIVKDKGPKTNGPSRMPNRHPQGAPKESDVITID